MYFEYNGTQYEFDENTMDVEEAVAIKKHASLTYKAFMLGLTELDPDALKALILVTLRRAGVTVRYQDIKFDIPKFAMSFSMGDDTADEDVSTDDEEAVGKSDPPPTQSGGTTGPNPPNDAPTSSQSSLIASASTVAQSTE